MKRPKHTSLFSSEAEAGRVIAQSAKAKKDPNQISIDAYLSSCGHDRPEDRAGRVAFARQHELFFATQGEWERLFKTY